ncbi:hypothetical protein RCL1_000709 [Eukaryota sp. TZLM3-RCL]
MLQQSSSNELNPHEVAHSCSENMELLKDEIDNLIVFVTDRCTEEARLLIEGILTNQEHLVNIFTLPITTETRLQALSKLSVHENNAPREYSRQKVLWTEDEKAFIIQHYIEYRGRWME